MLTESGNSTTKKKIDFNKLTRDINFQNDYIG